MKLYYLHILLVYLKKKLIYNKDIVKNCNSISVIKFIHYISSNDLYELYKN